MILFAAVGTLLGVTLASFTIFALIPVMTCAIVIAVASLSMLGSVGMAVAELASFLGCLQVGYLGSAALRFWLQRTLRRSTRPIPQN
jgi:hypothetical protein